MKKLILLIVILLAVLLVAAVAIWGKQYYENRYVGTDYYAMVPLDFDVTPEMRYTMNGEEAGLGKVYELTAFNLQGEAKTVEVNIYDDRHTFPQPGEFLYISASKQLVVGWHITDEKDVPDEVLALIKSL